MERSLIAHSPNPLNQNIQLFDRTWYYWQIGETDIFVAGVVTLQKRSQEPQTDQSIYP